MSSPMTRSWAASSGWPAGEHINLVETLAEAIADLCLAHRRVIEVRVMIEKLDVEPGASVGVEIERRRGEAS